MPELFPGLIVERMIPPELYVGLTTGKYELFGGVIRIAKGLPNAGQIVRHLLPISDVGNTVSLVNAYQLRDLAGSVTNLTQITQQVLQVATGTMILSGLNLAVSAIGFVFLNRKLTKLEDKLNQIQNIVIEIRNILERSERAELRAALRDLLKIDNTTSPENLHTLLHQSRRSLANVNERYRELLTGASTVESATAYEEYFSLTALAQCRCTAELGMVEIAYREIKEMGDFWKKEALRIMNDLLLMSQPHRFLFSDFVQEAPLHVMAEWLDFANDQTKGYQWIDELRAKTKSWYHTDEQVVKPLFNKLFARDTPDPVIREKEVVIPAIRKLVARSKVFEGHIAQYQLMAKHNIKPSELESKLSGSEWAVATDGYLICKPV